MGTTSSSSYGTDVHHRFATGAAFLCDVVIGNTYDCGPCRTRCQMCANSSCLKDGGHPGCHSCTGPLPAGTNSRSGRPTTGDPADLEFMVDKDEAINITYLILHA